MFNGRGFERRKTRAELGMPPENFFTSTGRVANPVVEAGALIADYSEKDDNIKAMWFKPYGHGRCAAVIEFTNDSKMLVRNIKTMMRNSFPDVELHLYSANSESGREIIKTARKLYQFEEKKRRNREKAS